MTLHFLPKVLPVTCFLLVSACCGSRDSISPMPQPGKLPISSDMLVGEWEGLDTTWGSYCLLSLRREQSGSFVVEHAFSSQENVQPVSCRWEIRDEKTVHIMLKEATAPTILSSFSGYLTGETTRPTMKLVASTEHGGVPYVFTRVADLETKRHQAREVINLPLSR